MFDLKPFKIDLKAIGTEDKNFEFALTDEYFKAIDAADIHQGNLSVSLTVRRNAGSFALNFHICGYVIVVCDKCLDNMQQPIETDCVLMVKFGEEYSDEDELIVVPEREGIIDVSWFIYEFIELNIPIKHVHAPGKCNPAMIRMLQEYSATRSSEADNNEPPIDSRWAELEKLKTIIKD